MSVQKFIRLFAMLLCCAVSSAWAACDWLWWWPPPHVFTTVYPKWSEEVKCPLFPIPENCLFLNPAFYFGFQAGYADNGWDTMSPLIVPGVTTQTLTKDTGSAYNIYLGYNYHYFSIEGGYINLPITRFTATDVNGVQTTVTVNDYALDFLLKGTVPLGCRSGLYAKAGAGYISSTPKGDYFNSNGQSPASQSHIGPAFGLGVNFAITENFIFDGSWLRFAGQGQAFNGNFNYIPPLDVFLAGFMYKIPVDYY